MAQEVALEVRGNHNDEKPMGLETPPAPQANSQQPADANNETQPAQLVQRLEASIESVQKSIQSAKIKVQDLIHQELRRHILEPQDIGQTTSSAKEFLGEVDTLTAKVQRDIRTAKAGVQRLLHRELCERFKNALGNAQETLGISDSTLGIPSLDISAQASGLRDAETPMLQPMDEWRAAGSTRPAGEDISEGTVCLRVEGGGHLQRTVNFLSQLRMNNQFHVLSVKGNPSSDLDVVVGLREPVNIKVVLLQMGDVEEVVPADGDREAQGSSQFQVRLASGRPLEKPNPV